jgi:hypothetical protein
VPKTALKSPPKTPRPAAPAPQGDNSPIEISIEEEVDLTELAKRIEQRTR